jgi:4-hydroxybenzoate polyprenyltransferase
VQKSTPSYQSIIFLQWHLASIATFILWYYTQQYNPTIEPAVLLAKLIFVFLGTLLGYTFIDWIGAIYTNSRTPKELWLLTHKHYVAYVMAVCIVVGGACLFMFNVRELLLIAALFVTTLFYDRGFKHYDGLRAIAYIKPIIISSVWVGATCALAQPTINIDLTMGYYFVWMLMVCIVYDEKDTIKDKAEGIKTINNQLSEKQYKLFIRLFFILFILINILKPVDGISVFYVFSTLVLGCVHVLINATKSSFLFALLVDLLVVVPFLLAVILG